MPFATYEGVRLFYTDAGSGDPPLLFVHGWCCDHTFWRRQVPAFRRRHRVVTVDLRGHGRSSKPRQEYTIAGFCEDLEWLLDELYLQRPVVVGHSMGGLIALHLGARARRPLSAVAMVDSPIFLRLSTDEQAQLDAFLIALRTPAFREAARAFIDRFMFVPSSPRAVRERVLERMLRTPQHVMESAMRNLWIDSADAATALRVPALAVFASSRQDEEKLTRSIASLQVGRTVGAGHFLQLEVPAQFNSMLRTFLEQIEMER